MEEKPIVIDVANTENAPVNKLSRLDRIKAFYVDSKQLGKEDEAYRLLLKKIFHWFERGKTPSEARRSLEQQKMKNDEAVQAISDALELYGDIGQSNREGLRHLLTNHFMRLATLAEKKKDYDLAAKTLERVARINNLDEHEDTTAKKGGRRIQVSYTANPERLKKAE